MQVSLAWEITHLWEILPEQTPPKEAQGNSQPQDLDIRESEKGDAEQMKCAQGQQISKNSNYF